MVKLGDILDLTKLDEMIQSGFISSRMHPTLNYSILNYTQVTQNNWHWTPETLICRGLVVDRETNEIVARPFPKFFGLEQLSEQERLDLQGYGLPDIVEKLDGSLAILYPVPDGYAITTRGSFTSDQSVAATQFWNDNFSHLNDKLNPKFTYLFEWVGPSNPHVVAYRRDDLVFIGMVEIETGRVASFDELFNEGANWFTMPEYYENVDWTTLKALEKENFEGYVLCWSEKMVKIKLDTYIRAHRIISRLTPKTVWEYMKNGDDLEVIRSILPEEHLNWFEDQVNTFDLRYNLLYHEALSILDSVKAYDISDRADRKRVASVITQYPHLQAALFAHHMNKVPLEDCIWKLLEP